MNMTRIKSYSMLLQRINTWLRVTLCLLRMQCTLSSDPKRYGSEIKNMKKMYLYDKNLKAFHAEWICKKFGRQKTTSEPTRSSIRH
mmetsp:Transcript_2297/g.3332  ORF Transcript_2297/g.3332 Transcript_2297/m.3332 type:complete len:86 (-) Transcript_2297:2736-2993(-)